MAKYIALAFREVASAKETDSQSIEQARRNALAHGLQITNKNRRAKATAKTIGLEVFRMLAANHAERILNNATRLSEAKAIEQAAIKLEIKPATLKMIR